MGTEPAGRRRPTWGRWGLVVVVAGALATCSALLWPSVLSAYHLERAGRELGAQPLTPAAYRVTERQLLRAVHWSNDNAQAYRLLAKLYRQGGDLQAAVEAQARYVSLQPRNPLGYWELAEDCLDLPVSELPLVSEGICGTDGDSHQNALIRFWSKVGYSAEVFAWAGDRLLESEDWDRAVILYQRALLLDPESARAWQGLASAYTALGNSQAALEAYARVVDADAGAVEAAAAHYSRARLLIEAQLWAEASAELAQAVALAPDNGQYHLEYGWALFQSEANIEGARLELTKAASLIPKNALTFVRLSSLDYAEGDYDGALECADQALALNPDQPWGWVRRGMALSQLGRLAEAETALRRAVELVPDRPAPHQELGHVLARLGRLDEAIDEYSQAVSLVPNNVLYNVNLANSYRAGGYTERAVEAYRRVLELDPGNQIAQSALLELER